MKKGIVHNFGYIKIKPTLNNIFITLTDFEGNVLLSKHAGILEFKGTKKRTPYVASQVMRELILEVEKLNINIKTFILQIKGYLRSGIINNIVRQLSNLNVNNVCYIEHLNIRTHNGLRAKKKRRL